MDEAFYRRGVTIVGVSFLILFAGFNASQGLQTSIHGDQLGNISLCLLYASFAAFSLVTPMLLRAVEDRFAQKWQFLLGAAPYVVLIFANNVKYGDAFNSTWILYFVLNVFVGLGAPFVWTAQAEFIGRCASKAAECSRSDISLMSSSLNAQFFAFFQLSGTIGSLISGLVLLLAGDEAVYKLFNLLGVLMCLSLVAFTFLPTVPRNTTSVNPPTAIETLSLAFTDTRTGFAVPITLCNGMMLGFFFGEFTATFICPVASAKMVGFVLAVFFTSNAAMTYLWGRLLERGVISRTKSLIIAALSQVCLLLALISMSSFARTYAKDNTTLIPGRTVQTGQVVLLFIAAIVYAVGDSVYESQVPAIFQTLYVDDPKSTAAYANYKMWQSLGFAVQFGIGSAISQFAPKVIILVFLHGLGLSCILLLGRRHPFEAQHTPYHFEYGSMNRSQSIRSESDSNGASDCEHVVGMSAAARNSPTSCHS